jgi:hypothetical protein
MPLPYSDIQATCAKQLRIFLPNAGYCHTILVEEENVEKLYEMAYRREFQFQSKRPSYNPSSGYSTGCLISAHDR